VARADQPRDWCRWPRPTARQQQRLAAALLRRLAAAERAQRCGARQGSTTPSLLDWARIYLPHYFTRPPSAMHLWLDEQFHRLEAQRGGKLNVIGPRGSAKSTLASLAWPLRLAVEGREAYIWLVSDTRAQAHAHLEHLQAELADNSRLAADYPQAVARFPVWRRGAVQLANGVRIEAFGTGQRIRGRRSKASRPTLIVCDDLQNDQHIVSATQRAWIERWFHGALLGAGTPSTNVVHLATALHRDALALVLHRTPGWLSRIFRAIEHWPDNMQLWERWEAIYADPDLPDAPARARAFYQQHRQELEAGARVLWPEEHDLYSLMCQRVERGRAVFEREQQGSPLNPAECEWPESYFDAAQQFDEWPQDLMVKTLALDPSKGSDARRGDFSAYVLLGIDRQGRIYLEADLARRPTPQMVADGVRLWLQARPDAFGIEEQQYHELLAGEFAAAFAAAGLPAYRPHTLANRVPKVVRIRRLGPYLAARRVRFKSRSAGTTLLLNQLRDFPLGDHDDGPDAAEMALRLALELLAACHPPDQLGNRLPVG